MRRGGGESLTYRQRETDNTEGGEGDAMEHKGNHFFLHDLWNVCVVVMHKVTELFPWIFFEVSHFIMW